jgi:hypothetical protein
MSRQMAVIWNLEWNGIVQGAHIQYSTDDNVSDQSMKIL